MITREFITEQPQSNEEKVLQNFKRQFPEFSQDILSMNLYCDIMKDGKIIAISDIPHSLDKVGYSLPSSWELAKDKGGRPKIYSDNRKMLTIKVAEKDINRLKTACIDKYGTDNGTMTQLINQIISDYLQENGY